MLTLETKQKLALSLKELMQTASLEKITVTKIVAHCNLTRQTFYRNFEDKYALVNWYFEQSVHTAFSVMNHQKTLRQALENKFCFIQQECDFFRVAFTSRSYQSLIEYDYRYILQFYTKIIMKKTKLPLSKEVSFALELYCRGSVAQTVAWVNLETRASPKEMACLLEASLPCCLRDLLMVF